LRFHDEKNILRYLENPLGLKIFLALVVA